MRSGQPQKAVELLEKARILLRNDPELQVRVLTDLVAAYDATGQYDRARQWEAQLARLLPPAPPAAPGVPVGTGGYRPIGRAASRVWLLPTLVACSLLVGISATWLTIRHWPDRVAMAPATVPSTTATFQSTPRSTSRPATEPSLRSVATAPTPATGPSSVFDMAKLDRQQLLKDNVGMVIVVLRYEGTVNRRACRIDVPLGMGTAFAVHATGVMLTNRHVVEAGKPEDVPVTLEDAGLPTMTLRGTSYLVCFGATSREQFPAKLLHKSETFDVAVLKINRPFPNPLTIASKPLRQGDEILCCGFPGAITQVLNRAANTPAKVVDVSRKWQQTGFVDPLDQFSADSFNSTLTRGIVSAPERNVRGVSYLQMDAAISAGNSGGPVLNTFNEVIGIATFGLRGDSLPTNNYNFALLLDQAKEEIEPYLKGN